MKIITIMIAVIILMNAMTSKAEVIIQNFEYGISDFVKYGDTNKIELDTMNVYKGKYSLKIENNNSGIAKKVNLIPLSVIEFNSYFKCSIKNVVKAKLSIKFYNRNDSLLLETKTCYSDSVWNKIVLNAMTPPNTSYAIFQFSIEKDSNEGIVYYDECFWNTDILMYRSATECNLDKYLMPFWASDSVVDEPVLMYSENNKLASGNLMNTPINISRVNNYFLWEEYTEGIDYSRNGKYITKQNSSKMPFRADTSIKKDNLFYNTYVNGQLYFPQHVTISYNHMRDWDGPMYQTRVANLPRTYRKLREKEKLNIAILGNSLTKGMNVTGIAHFRPYMPTYFDLFSEYLKKYYNHNKITATNSAMPGSIINGFGVNSFTNYLKPLDLDLLIIDYGMVDMWTIFPQEYEDNLKIILDSMFVFNPNIEIILMSNMRFDPQYLPDTNDFFVKYCYLKIKGYQEILKKYEKIGVTNIDMYNISDMLYKLKKAKDVLSDPIHPNDYMARWYAQQMINTLVPVMNGSINKIINRKNGQGIDNGNSLQLLNEINLKEVDILTQQDWYFYKIENERFRITSLNSGLSLGLIDTITNESNIVQNTTSKVITQDWLLIDLNNGYYKLKNRFNNKVLSVASDNLICENNEDGKIEQEWTIKYSYTKPYISLYKDSILVENTLQEKIELIVESNTSWLVSNNVNWLSVEKINGNGDSKIIFNCQPNKDSLERFVNIEFTANGTKTAKLKVVQKSGVKSQVEVDKTREFKYEFPQSNNTILSVESIGFNVKKFSIEIYDISGRLLAREYNFGKNRIVVDLSSISTGQYILKVITSSNENIEIFYKY